MKKKKKLLNDMKNNSKQKKNLQNNIAQIFSLRATQLGKIINSNYNSVALKITIINKIFITPIHSIVERI